MKANNTRIPGKLLFLGILLCIQHVAGFIPGLSAGMQLKASDKTPHVQRMLCAHALELGVPPHFWTDDPAEDGSNTIHTKKHRRKTRLYLTASTQQYSFAPRLAQLQDNLSHRLHVQENKTGIYQWQDAFLPAYYRFLFRYTLF